MMRMKLYDVHGPSALTNYKPLTTGDGKYFYWDNKPFAKYKIGDIVIWINRRERECLFTKIDNTSLVSSFSDGQNRIKDNSYDLPYTAQTKDQYETFYRFKIIEKVTLPESWNYTDPSTFGSQLMAYILYEDNVSNPEARISKLNDIKSLFKSDTEPFNLITEAINLLSLDKRKRNPVLPKVQPVNIKLSNTMEEKIILAIKTKPFILLAGISGTGKSRLVRTLAFQTCAKAELRTDLKKPGNFELIPVRPNWHDSSELMGYISRINGEKYISTAFLKFIAKAWKNPEVPFFLCLDEMNLAPVEQYFAEYLSIIETRQVKEGQIVSDYLISKSSFENEALYIQLLNDLDIEDERFNEGVSIPNNLVVIGTVNMDETTHSFSRKVLDRAMTFEINGIDLNAGLEETKSDWDYPKGFINANEVIGEFTAGNEVVNQYPESKKIIEFLQRVNNELEGTPFKIAYRARDEFLIYCYHASKDKSNSNWMNNALDEMTNMKILSRIEGDESKTADVLRNLQNVLTADFKKSNSKLKEMETRLQKSGYTSYWS